MLLRFLPAQTRVSTVKEKPQDPCKNARMGNDSAIWKSFKPSSNTSVKNMIKPGRKIQLRITHSDSLFCTKRYKRQGRKIIAL